MKKALFAFSFVLLAAIACDKNNNDEPSPEPQDTTKFNLETVAENANGDFTFNIVKQLNAAADGNFLLSPISVQMAFALLANGADGNSRQQILDAFGYSSIDKLNSDCQNVILDWKKLNEDYVRQNSELSEFGVNNYQQTIETANAIWADRCFPLFSEYTELCKKYFDAEAATLNYANVDSTLAVMNGWCNQKTHGMIPKMLNEDDIDDDAIAILANALYFRADWNFPFEEDATQKADFTDGANAVSQVDMMWQQEDFKYVRTENFAMAELPYSGSTCMDIILPGSDISVNQCVEQLSQTRFDAAIEKMSLKKLNLHLPKFELNFNHNLVDIMKQLGVVDVFSPVTADLSKMGSGHPNAHVNDAFQLSRISVDESGTEAAAVTVIEVKDGISLDIPIEFNVNHPFAYIIRDKQTGVILFVGKVEKL